MLTCSYLPTKLQAMLLLFNKSESLECAKVVVVVIYSLFKQKIKSCNAKRRRLCRRTVKNNNRSNQQKSNFALAAHFFCTFLCRCFARLQHGSSRNFLLTRFMEEFRTFCSSLFFHCRSFSPCIGGH